MALSADRELFQSRRPPQTRSVLMAASAQIYKGSFVMINSAGLAQVAAAVAGNRGVAGVALENVLSDASTPTYVQVQFGGPFRIPAADLNNVAQADVGTTLYADDDETLNDVGGGAANTPPAGYLVELQGTDAWVEIDPARNAQVGPHA